jgi:hypothetical protein
VAPAIQLVKQIHDLKRVFFRVEAELGETVLI